MASAKYKLDQAYQGTWGNLGANSANCSGFLKSLQKEFGFTIPDYEADRIIDYLDAESGREHGEWTKLATGDWMTALRNAQAGKFVVAGLKSSDVRHANGWRA